MEGEAEQYVPAEGEQIEGQGDQIIQEQSIKSNFPKSKQLT